jgi:hypothetical protein
MQDTAASSVPKTLDTLFDDDDDDGDLMLLDDDVSPHTETTHGAQTGPSAAYLSLHSLSHVSCRDPTN